MTHIPCFKTSDFSHGHTEISCSVVFSSAISTCLCNQLVAIATYHQSHFHTICKFYQLSVLLVLLFWGCFLGFVLFFFFFPFVNNGLLLCGYWRILQLFALCIFLPPTFSQLTFHRLCFYSFFLTSVGSGFIF